MGVAFYRLISRALWLQFHDVFSFHLSLHQFNVAIKGGYKLLFHGIWYVLDVQPNLVVFKVDGANTSNIILCKVIFYRILSSKNDAPPNSLIDSTTSPKVKTTKE